MKKSTVYVTPDHKYHVAPVDGAVEKTLLEAEDGKVLVHPLHEIEYLRKIVDSVDGWTEIDAPEEDEPTTEDKAEAYDILMGGDAE